MTAGLKLVIFDVDGTLVDSQGVIVASMTAAFDAIGQVAPDRRRILSIVGLSLDRAMAALAPDRDAGDHRRMAEAYRDQFAARRHRQGDGDMPLYPGAREVLEDLVRRPEILVGVATGKSRRGLEAVIEAHDLAGIFITRQVADDHPSKPHPSMILTAMAETGVGRADTVMIGDTSYDMDMAAAAGVPALGVSWGYQPPAALNGAHAVLDRFADLPGQLETIWKDRT
ncbi:MAG: HAD-IA family hydrolase [Marinibacterium sp.]